MRSLALTLLLAAVPSAAAAKENSPADFQPDLPRRSIALGPVPGGRVDLTVETGWLKSGIRLDVGLIGSVDLVLRTDTMLLYNQLDGQTGLYAGARITPFNDGTVRVSLEGFYGQVILLNATGSNVDSYGGELNAGAVTDLITFYGRAQIRGVHSHINSVSATQRESEVGFGLERALGKVLLGAEAYGWARPDHSGMFMWRVRAAIAF